MTTVQQPTPASPTVQLFSRTIETCTACAAILRSLAASEEQTDGPALNWIADHLDVASENITNALDALTAALKHYVLVGE